MEIEGMVVRIGSEVNHIMTYCINLRILVLLLGITVVLTQDVFADDYLEPGKRLASPDKQWEVWVVKHLDTDALTAEFFLAQKGSSHQILLATNQRHFGAEWSPDSSALLVYDNLGSGTSNAILFHKTSKGWNKIYATPYGFHIIWRAQTWLPDKVILHSYAGGSQPDKLPSAVTIHF